MHKNTVDDLLNGKVDDFASGLLLFQKIEAALEQRLETQPTNEAMLNQLAVCKRKQGKLAEAVALYADLAKHYPEKLHYRYTSTALSGCLDQHDILGDENLFNACPLFEWQNFLPEEEIECIIKHMLEHKQSFLPAKVGRWDDERSYYDPDVRNNTALSLKGNPLKKSIRDLMAERLPDIIGRLGLKSFSPSNTEVKLRAYHNGEYFRVHQDGGKGRVISYTYFFHPEPKRFAGGELILFDTNTKESTFAHSFTRILPKRNTIVFFPSNYYHAVLPVKTDDNDFLSARFVINGHVWE